MARCLACGSSRIVRRREDQIRDRIDWRTIIVPDVPFHECLACGERFYAGRDLRRADLYEGYLSDGGPPGKCPVCRTRRFGRRVVTVRFDAGEGQATTARDVVVWRCGRCAQRYYPRETVKQVQRSWRSKRARARRVD